MAGSQRQDAAEESPLVAKLIRWPSDWVERVDQVRGEQSFSDFVRNAVWLLIEDEGLSAPPAWGQGAPKIITAEEIVEQIRVATEESLGTSTDSDTPASKRSA